MAERRGVEFVGFLGMQALVNAINLVAVQRDSRTFLADASGDMFFQESAIELEGAIRNRLDDTLEMEIQQARFPKSLAWKLEDLGIIE